MPTEFGFTVISNTVDEWGRAKIDGVLDDGLLALAPAAPPTGIEDKSANMANKMIAEKLI